MVTILYNIYLVERRIERVAERGNDEQKHTFFSNSRALDCKFSYDSPVRDTPDETPRS
jgi:hypothetical protein